MTAESRSGTPRVVSPNRSRLLLQPTDLDRIIPDEHPARGVWALVESLDLSAFYEEIEARGSDPGRPATDPKVLLSLWVYANSEGVGSARLLERLCERDAPYRSICGGVPVNHHTLSDFRTGHEKKIDGLLTQTLAALMKHGVVRLQRVAQDGMKVRASADAASFRRRQSLDRCLEEAKEQVRKLKRELAEDGGASTRRERAARERAAEERQAAIEAALAELPRIEAKREERDQKKPSDAKRRSEVRVSTTDPECRVMKMADGGFRPAYNVQLATDESGFIVGADVTNNGTDQPHVAPMLDEIAQRTGQTPGEYLVDGGFVTLENIEVISARGATVYAPTPKPRNENVDRYAKAFSHVATTARTRTGQLPSLEVEAPSRRACSRRFIGALCGPLRGALTLLITICIISQRVIGRRHAAVAPQGPDAHPRARGGTEDPLHVEGPARAGQPGIWPDEEDACDLLANLNSDDSAGRLESAATGEWMYLFKPQLAGTVLYVKLILRNDCVVVSFHEDEGGGHEEDA